MDQENLVERDGAESSNCTVQDDIRHTNGNVHGNENELNRSVESSQSSAPSSSNFSVSSETDLLIPGKLYTDIVNLKKCYKEIISLIDPCNNTEDITVENPSSVLMLNKEQMLAGMKKRNNKFSAETAKSSLVALLDCVRPLCLPVYQSGLCPKPSSVTKDNQIELLTARVESLCSQNKSENEALTTQVESLKSTLSNFESFFKTFSQSQQPATSPDPIPIPPDHVPSVNHNIPPVCEYSDDFISSDEANELFQYLNGLTSYKNERGRSTVKFGERYTYNGSREDSIVEFPPLIKNILDKINNDHVGAETPLLNSCLVTKYSGPRSYIPEHSDNERSIHPSSNIYTVSVGFDTTVRFRNIHSDDVKEQTVKAGSVYAMTRASQDLFKHSIARNQSLSETDTRISLTFRSLHWRNNNSTVIVGDSNTGGLKFSKFGRDSSNDHNGTFGNAMPGKRVAAFKIDQLDPVICTGFNNVVIHCGLNDIRGSDVASEEQVKELYVALKTKINDIVTLNKRARIYVSTLLPTKSHEINLKVKMFNSFINDDLSKSFKDIRIISHYSKFSSVSGILSNNLSKEFTNTGEPDLLHLNESGLRLLSTTIKSALFYRKRAQERGTGGGTVGGSAVQQEGRSYSSVVNRGRPGRRRGGSNNHSHRS